MPAVKKHIEALQGLRPETVPEEILTGSKPVVLRGFVADWPLVAIAGKAGAHAAPDAVEYLLGYSSGAEVTVTRGAPDIKGHVSYSPDLTTPNVTRERAPLDTVLNACLSQAEQDEPELLYVASTNPAECLPGLTAANPMKLGDRPLLESIWIGNQSRIPAHYDLPDNIACVATGRRRFTLFPPEQLENLYVGPLDMTPAGQPISVVDFNNPDFDRFPKFRKALDAALVAELEPGDAIFIPSMWWHQVEGLSNFNVLMNYWWRQSPEFMGPPVDALYHALLTVRDLPAEQRRAWKTIFNHYVFDADEETSTHIPDAVKSLLAPLDDITARQLRAYLLNRLNR